MPFTPALADALRKVRVADYQVMFSGQPDEVLDDVDPDLQVHVILYGDAVVGMFRIDLGYHKRYPFASITTPGLRTFLIDHGTQGRGIATGVCNLLRDYLRDNYKDATAVYLTVNLMNSAARKVYLNGGFVDTGDEWPHGIAGPQNILRLDLAD